MAEGVRAYLAGALALLLLVSVVIGLVLLDSPLSRAARDDSDQGGVGGLLGRLFPGLFGSSSQEEVAEGGVAMSSSTPTFPLSSTTTVPTTTAPSSPTTTTTLDWLQSMNSTQPPPGSSPSQSGQPIDQAFLESGTTPFPFEQFASTTTSPEMIPSSISPQLPTGETSSCPVTVDLASLCYDQITDDLYIYFDWNLTLANVETVVLFSSVLKELLLQCTPGEWCLPSVFLRVFPEVGEEYYESPVCYESLLGCLKTAAEARKTCQNYKYVQTLGSSLSLLCNLGGVPGLTSSCFSRVLALLHVTVADTMRSINEEPISAAEICTSRKAKMLKQFECLAEVCPNHRSFLSDFEPWQWFLTDQSILDQTCSFTDVCSAFPVEEVAPPQENTRLPDVPFTSVSPPASTPFSPPASTSDSYDFISNVQQAGGGVEGLPDLDQVNKAQQGQEAEDQSDVSSQNLSPALASIDPYTRLLVGVAGGVAVGIVGLTCLICMCWRQGKNNKHGSMKGYTKLPSHVDE